MGMQLTRKMRMRLNGKLHCKLYRQLYFQPSRSDTMPVLKAAIYK